MAHKFKRACIWRNAAVPTFFCAVSAILPPTLVAQPSTGNDKGYNNYYQS
jgi:hypothetical protein